MDFDKFEENLRARSVMRERRRANATLDFEEVFFSSASAQVRSGIALRSNRRYDRLAFFLIIFTLLCSLPAGGRVPLAWALYTTVLAVVTLVHLFLTYRKEPERDDPLAAQKWVLAPIGVMAVMALFQLLPIPFGSYGALPPEMQPRHLTISSSMTMLGLVRITGYVLFFALMIWVSENARRVEWMLTLLFYGLVAHAVWALVSLSFLGDTFFLGEKVRHAGSATGTFVNRNNFATMMGFGLSLGVCLTIQKTGASKIRMPRGRKSLDGRWLDIILSAALTGVILVALIASQSRMGLAASVLGAAIAATIALAKNGISPVTAALRVGGIGFAVVLVALLLTGGGVGARSLFVENDLAVRMAVFQRALSMIADRPLTGVGLDGFAIAFEVVRDGGMDVGHIWDFPHNTYLTLWSELGIVAGSMPVIAGGIAFWACIDIIRRRSEAYIAAVVAVGAIVTAAVHSLVDFSLEISGNVYVLVALIALGVARLRRSGGSS